MTYYVLPVLPAYEPLALKERERKFRRDEQVNLPDVSGVGNMIIDACRNLRSEPFDY